jgi:hypothetical protein
MLKEPPLPLTTWPVAVVVVLVVDADVDTYR